MKMKKMAALALVAVMILSLSACGLFSSSGGSVYWLNYKPELEDTLLSIASRYKEEKGVDVKIVTPESGTYNSALRTEMASDEPPTMFVVTDQKSADEWASSALDLSSRAVTSELTTSAYNLTDEDDKTIAIPYCLECYGIAVNPSLIEVVGYSVDDITDFDTLKLLAEAIHNNASWLGYDAFSSPDLDDGSAWRLTAHLANLEYYYEEKDGSSWSECPASLTGAYMQNYKQLYDVIVNNAASTPEEAAAGGHQPLDEFAAGKTAFCLAGSWDYAKLSAAIPDVTIIPYYCGVKGEEKAALNSGSENYWAVNRLAPEEDQKATLAFMKWLVTDAEASSMLVEQLGNMPYKNAKEAVNGFLAKQDQYLADGCYRMDWLMTYQPNVEAYRADLCDALKVYNTDQTDENWEKVRAAFVDGWAKQYDALNNVYPE